MPWERVPTNSLKAPNVYHLRKDRGGFPPEVSTVKCATLQPSKAEEEKLWIEQCWKGWTWFKNSLYLKEVACYRDLEEVHCLRVWIKLFRDLISRHCYHTILHPSAKPSQGTK
jgi:hypothetical protein